jgi:hypothetical protein
MINSMMIILITTLGLVAADYVSCCWNWNYVVWGLDSD